MVATVDCFERNCEMKSSIRRVSRWLRVHWRESVVSLLVLVVLLVGSEFLLKALHVHSYILPTPTEVWAQFRVDLISRVFWIDIWTTSEEIILGGLIGVALRQVRFDSLSRGHTGNTEDCGGAALCDPLRFRADVEACNLRHHLLFPIVRECRGWVEFHGP